MDIKRLLEKALAAKDMEQTKKGREARQEPYHDKRGYWRVCGYKGVNGFCYTCNGMGVAACNGAPTYGLPAYCTCPRGWERLCEAHLPHVKDLQKALPDTAKCKECGQTTSAKNAPYCEQCRCEKVLPNTD